MAMALDTMPHFAKIGDHIQRLFNEDSRVANVKESIGLISPVPPFLRSGNGKLPILGLWMFRIVILKERRIGQMAFSSDWQCIYEANNHPFVTDASNMFVGF